MDIYNKIEKSLLGLNSTDTKFAKELQEVKKYYEFYEGRPETIEDDTEEKPRCTRRLAESDLDIINRQNCRLYIIYMRPFLHVYSFLHCAGS